ncbi:MAG: DMT family transporter [Thermomicrobiales bacterium]
MRSNIVTIYILIAFGLGCTQALQAVMLGSMGRMRGPIESAWVSILGTVAILGLALTLQAISGHPPALPFPFDNTWVAGLVGLSAAILLILSLRGIPGGYAVTGMLAGPYIASAAFLAPRLGVGLFFAAVITGQLLTGVIFDHLGVFGIPQRPADVPRILGILALIAGVILIRGRR